jgi:DNA polymerase I
VWRWSLKVTFWLLDISSKLRSETAELWLWGIDDRGNRCLVIDKNFVDYFYLVIEEGVAPSKVAEDIRKALAASIMKTEVASRLFFGKPVQTLKVYCRNPKETAKLARSLRSFEGVKECLEDDVRLSMRYLIDNNVVPCGWHEAQVMEEKNVSSVRIDKVYQAEAAPQLLENQEVPPLRILSFSTICYSREGTPKPNRNPVIIISAVTGNAEEKQFFADEKRNDKQLITEFINYIRKFDPDIIVNYGANKIDWTYLIERCRRLKMKFDIDRAHTEPHTSVYGHFSLTGIANIDLADFVDEFPIVKVKNLANMADHLGIIKISQRTMVEDIDFADYWDDKHKRGSLKRFSLDNAHSLKGVAELLLDFAMQLSSLVSLPLDHVMTAAVGFRVEWFLIKHAQKIGELIPKRVEQPYRPYAGGLVLKPIAGVHENIAVLDFKSMYPNIMITYNLSPDTYVSPKEHEPASGFYEAPEVKHKFRKAPPGFYKEILTYLIGVRSEIRGKMKNLNAKSVEYRVLDARQKAVKVITNAAYGYAGWTGARWYIKPVAEAASAWGRHTIQTAIAMAKKAGLKVVYGDTDSLFVSNDEKKNRELEKEIEGKLGLDVERGEVYVRVFFTEAKKRYAGLRQDGSLDIVGLEVIRGDWAEVAKKVQEHVLEIILKERLSQKAVDYVQNVVNELQQRKVPFRDLIIWKTLTNPLQKYAIKASHVEAAKMMKDKGWSLTVGDKVGYVIVNGEGRLYQRVKPYLFAAYDEVDVNYYVTKQVVPAAARVLKFFDVTEADLLRVTEEEKASKSLLDFMGN